MKRRERSKAALFAFPTREAAESFIEEVKARGMEFIRTTHANAEGEFLVLVKEKP